MQTVKPQGRPWHRAGRFVFATVLLFFFSNVHASGKPQPQPAPGDWVYDQTVNNVECYHKLAQCEGTTVVLLKFNNRNNSSVNVGVDFAFLIMSNVNNKTLQL